MALTAFGIAKLYELQRGISPYAGRQNARPSRCNCLNIGPLMLTEQPVHAVSASHDQKNHSGTSKPGRSLRRPASDDDVGTQVPRFLAAGRRRGMPAQPATAGPNSRRSAGEAGLQVSAVFRRHVVGSMGPSGNLQPERCPSQKLPMTAPEAGYLTASGSNEGADSNNSFLRSSGTRSSASGGIREPKRLASKACWRRITRSH
jgi:hypothetical protein